jgi:hypothetical protein
VKEGARRDAAAAQACFVDDGDDDVLLGSRELYVLVERSEAPSEFFDFTSPRVAAKVSSKSGIARTALLGKKRLSPSKNWKGEDIGLTRGAAYVFIWCGRVVGLISEGRTHHFAGFNTKNMSRARYVADDTSRLILEALYN